MPPRLVRVTPDTNSLRVTDKVASFYFDETINDRGSGPQEIDNFFLVSPSDGSNHVSWHRSRIDIRPRLGFRPNTAYTIILLPGLSDLRNNAMKKGATVVFSTGSEIPTLRLTGTVFDWPAERPAARALIQAITTDSITYLAQSDSAGQFSVGPLPPGSYLLRAIVDQNNNRALDRNEPYDSVRVTAPERAPVELLAIPRDTLPTRILTVVVADSVTLRATFDRPLDPAAIPSVSAFRIVGPDSATVAISAALTPRQESERVSAQLQARGDSVRRADSVVGRKLPTASNRPAEPAPLLAMGAKPSVPPPPTMIVLRLARPLAPNTLYRLRVTDARSLSGRLLSSERSFTSPRPAPPPAARPAGDSLRVPARASTPAVPALPPRP